MVMVMIRTQSPPLSGSRKKLIACMALWLALATAGCDSASSGPPISRGEARAEKLKTNLSAEEARDIAKPLSETPGLTVEAGTPQNGSASVDAQLNPSMGIKTKRLFDTRTENDDERFERLEAAVQALRDDFDKASPSINRLMAIEQEIQTLVDQLQSLVGENGMSASAADVPIPPVSSELLEDEPAGPTTMPPLPPDAQAAQAAQATQNAQAVAQPAPPLPVPVPTATPAPAAVVPPPAPSPPPVAAATSGGAVLKALRMGDHGKTTRIVFETAGKIDYSADVDPEKILLVNFTSGTSSLSGPQLKSTSGMVKSIDITPQGNGGFIVAMSLSKMTKIVKQGVLKPDSQSPNYRVYIDIER